MSTINLI